MRHGERDERVEQQPPGGEYQCHARDHADRSPHVGHEMLAVRLQRNALVAASRALQYQRHRKIDRRCCRADTQSENGRLERLRVDEPRHCRGENAGRGEHDQRAFDACGEVFGLRVAILVAFVRRGRCQPQHRYGEQRRGEVHERLERIGQQPHRAGSATRRAF